MPLPNPITAPCVSAPPGGPGAPGGPGDSDTLLCPDTGGSGDCKDHEWAADHPTECPGAETIVGFEVVPASETIEVGASFPFSANLLFSRGSKHGVTEKTQWASASPAIAAMQTDPGTAKGIAVGTTTITGAYRGYSDTSALTVVAKCAGQFKLDIVLVIDRSGSMLRPEPNQKSRMVNAIRAASAFAKNVDYTKDRVSVVSFAGTWYSPVGGSPIAPPVRRPETTKHLPLSSDLPSVLVALQDVVSEVNKCGHTTPPVLAGYVPTFICCTAIGAGMKLAGEELAADGRTDTDVRQMIVLLTDGDENICDPDPDTESVALRARGIIMVVIAAAVPLKQKTLECAVPPPAFNRTVEDRMKTWTSCDLFFTAESAEELPDIYASLPRDICLALNDDQSCLYGYGYGF